MTVRELFDFVTDPSITCHNIDQYLDKVGARHTASLNFQTAESVLQLAPCDWSIGNGDGSGAHVRAAVQSGSSGRGGTNTRSSTDRKQFKHQSHLTPTSPPAGVQEGLHPPHPDGGESLRARRRPDESQGGGVSHQRTRRQCENNHLRTVASRLPLCVADIVTTCCPGSVPDTDGPEEGSVWGSDGRTEAH